MRNHDVGRADGHRTREDCARKIMDRDRGYSHRPCVDFGSRRFCYFAIAMAACRGTLAVVMVATLAAQVARGA